MVLAPTPVASCCGGSSSTESMLPQMSKQPPIRKPTRTLQGWTWAQRTSDRTTPPPRKPTAALVGVALAVALALYWIRPPEPYDGEQRTVISTCSHGEEPGEPGQREEPIAPGPPDVDTSLAIASAVARERVGHAIPAADAPSIEPPIEAARPTSNREQRRRRERRSERDRRRPERTTPTTVHEPPPGLFGVAPVDRRGR